MASIKMMKMKQFVQGVLLIAQKRPIRLIFDTNNCNVPAVGATRGLFTSNPAHYFNRGKWPQMVDFNERRKRIAVDQKLRRGREAPRTRRSDYIEWNHASELSAFAARLGEKFDETTLRQAMISSDYVEAEARRQRELGISEGSSDSGEAMAKPFEDNSKLARAGTDTMESTLAAYARTALPYLPEEGVDSVVRHLTTDKLLAHVSFHLGTMDLILSEEYPPTVETMSTALRAVVGALASVDRARAEKLVLDVVATQLHGCDLLEVWNIRDPRAVLARMLANDDRGSPEARLLWASGKETMLACYHVAIYSDKELIGQAPGETPSIAEDMAMRDAIRRLCRFADFSRPLPFGRDLEKVELKTSPNPSVIDWTSKRRNENVG